MTAPTLGQSKRLAAGLTDCMEAALDQSTVDLLAACQEHLAARIAGEEAALAQVARERAAHAQTREALREAQARWQALHAAKSALSGVPACGAQGRPSTGDFSREVQ